MHSYTCPKCKTILKRQEPVPPGKKMKCPKCQKIFAPDTKVKLNLVAMGARPQS